MPGGPCHYSDPTHGCPRRCKTGTGRSYFTPQKRPQIGPHSQFCFCSPMALRRYAATSQSFLFYVCSAFIMHTFFFYSLQKGNKMISAANTLRIENIAIKYKSMPPKVGFNFRMGINKILLISVLLSILLIVSFLYPFPY